LANIPAMEKKGEQERKGARARKEALGYGANRQDNRCLPHMAPFGLPYNPHYSACFFQPEQCFSLTTIQPEQCFQPVSAKILPAERGPAESDSLLFFRINYQNHDR